MRIKVEIRTTRDTEKIQSGCCKRVTMNRLKMSEKTVMNMGLVRGRSFLLM